MHEEDEAKWNNEKKNRKVVWFYFEKRKHSDKKLHWMAHWILFTPSTRASSMLLKLPAVLWSSRCVLVWSGGLGSRCSGCGGHGDFSDHLTVRAEGERLWGARQLTVAVKLSCHYLAARAACTGTFHLERIASRDEELPVLNDTSGGWVKLAELTVIANGELPAAKVGLRSSVLDSPWRTEIEILTEVASGHGCTALV